MIFKKLRKDIKEFLNEKFGLEEEGEDPWKSSLSYDDYNELLRYLGYVNSNSSANLVKETWELDLSMEEDGKCQIKNILVLLGGILNLRIPNILVKKQ